MEARTIRRSSEASVVKLSPKISRRLAGVCWYFYTVTRITSWTAFARSFQSPTVSTTARIAAYAWSILAFAPANTSGRAVTSELVIAATMKIEGFARRIDASVATSSLASRAHCTKATRHQVSGIGWRTGPTAFPSARRTPRFTISPATRFTSSAGTTWTTSCRRWRFSNSARVRGWIKTATLCTINRLINRWSTRCWKTSISMRSRERARSSGFSISSGSELHSYRTHKLRRALRSRK